MSIPRPKHIAIRQVLFNVLDGYPIEQSVRDWPLIPADIRAMLEDIRERLVELDAYRVIFGSLKEQTFADILLELYEPVLENMLSEDSSEWALFSDPPRKRKKAA